MAAPKYVLDTNIILALIRANPLCEFINATYQLSQPQTRAMICIVSHGEVWSLAKNNNWGQKKCDSLANMLANVVTLDINRDSVIDAYVEMDIASLQHPPGAANIGKNDLWIAAVTKAAGTVLLTCDKDFSHLHPAHIQREWIDPDRFKSSPETTKKT